jgi:hypothetical protein
MQTQEVYLFEDFVSKKSNHVNALFSHANFPQVKTYLGFIYFRIIVIKEGR